MSQVQGFLIAYALLAAVFIINENRRPQATFAWMLLFFAVPGVGILVYLLFGRNRRVFSRQRKLVQQEVPGRLGQLLEDLGQQHDRAVAEMERRGGPDARLARLVRHNAHSVLTSKNEVEVLQDASVAYPRLFADLRAAKRFIYLQTYSLASDEVGDQLKTILLDKAASGVDVRLLYDPVGSLLMLSPFYRREMRRGGVRMEPYSPLWRLHTIGYRNHRRIVVVDGLVGYTGGLNIGQEHIHPGRGFDGWRDTHLRIEGSATAVLQSIFAVDWRNAVGEDLQATEFDAPTTSAANRPAVAGADHRLGAGFSMGGHPAALLRNDRRSTALRPNPIAVLRAGRFDHRGPEVGGVSRRRRSSHDQRARSWPSCPLLGRKHVCRRGVSGRCEGAHLPSGLPAREGPQHRRRRCARSAPRTWTFAASA